MIGRADSPLTTATPTPSPAPEAVYWYARARGILRMGPYGSQLAAWEACMGLDGTPAPEAAVWCERKEQPKGC